MALVAGVSRDVLKWLQSLDLSYSVKNVKRDFANGFLVAEIFSRYFPHEVQMHSFDNGISLQKKLANWELLEKFFVKKKVPITRIMIDNVIHCKDNAAIPMLETIYTCLTSKKVQNVRPNNDDELIPPFARPTASFVLKENLKDSELVTTLADEMASKDRAAQLLEEHSQTLRHEKVLEPGRFTSPASPPRPTQRVQARPIPAEVPAGQIEFKEVQVRTISGNVAQLRAQRDTTISSSRPDLSERGRLSQSSEEKTVVVKPITELLNSIVEQYLEEQDSAQQLETKDKIVSLVDRLSAQKLKMEDESVLQVFKEIEERSEALAHTVLMSPKEFFRLFGILGSLLTMPETSRMYAQVLRIFKSIGAHMTQRDAFLAQQLFTDYGLRHIVPLLKCRPAKRRGLLDLMYHYCDRDKHLRVIKALHEALEDMGCFLHCLVILMHLEPLHHHRHYPALHQSRPPPIQEDGAAGQLSEELLDLYLYYAITALAQESPSLRAVALSMLGVVARQSHLLVMPLLDRLDALKDDPWWEVSVQLIRVCGVLLEQLPLHDNQSSQVLHMLVPMLETSYSPLVRKAAAAYLAPVHRLHNGPLEKAYTDLLARLPERDFTQVMLPHHPSAASPDADPAATGAGLVPGSGGGGGGLGALPSAIEHMSGLFVAETLALKIVEAELENLEHEHLLILDALLHPSPASSSSSVPAGASASQQQLVAPGNGGTPSWTAEEVGRWGAVLKQLELHLFVALADAELCGPGPAGEPRIVSVLYTWIVRLGKAAVEPEFSKEMEELLGKLELQHLLKK